MGESNGDHRALLGEVMSAYVQSESHGEIGEPASRQAGEKEYGSPADACWRETQGTRF